MTIKEEQKDERAKKKINIGKEKKKDNYPFFNQSLALSRSRGATYSLNKQNKADYSQIAFIYYL